MATFVPNVTDIFPQPAMYRPDFSFLDTMLRRKQAMYDQGFAEVSSKYSALSRALTNPLNAQQRDKFLMEAQKQLKNLSAMDLSQQQNVASASNVFTPLLEDKKIIGDMVLSAHWDQQERIADALRLKDGGKEYSEDNINYVRQQREAFRNSDPATYGSFLAAKRSYTPYYNYNSEVQEAMKNFKPSRVITEHRNGMYINRVEDQSWYKDEVAKYLNGVLSDKAKQQMGIEASVRLASNPTALSGLYLQEAAKAIPVIDKNIDTLTRKINAEKDPVTVKRLKQDLEYYTTQKEDLETNVASIRNKDLSFIQANAEKLAKMIYMNQKMEGYINSFTRKDISEEIKFDQVALTIFKENEEWKRTRYKEDRADEREKGKNMPMMPVSVAGENVTAPSLSSLTAETKVLQKNMEAKHAELKDHIATVLGGGRTANSITEAEFETYIRNNPKDKMVNTYTKMGLDLQSKKAEALTFENNANEYARENMGDSFNLLQAMRAERDKVLRSSNGVPQVKWDPQRKTFIKTMNLMGKEIKMDVGKYYNEPSPTGLSPAANDKKTNMIMANSIAAANLGYNAKYFDKLEETYNNLRKDYLTNPKYKEVTTNRKGFQLNTNDPRFKSAADYIQQNSNIDKDKIMSITYVPTPTGLDIHVGYSETKESPVNADNAVQLLKTRFANNQISVDKDLKVIKIKGSGSNISPQLDPYSFVDPIYKSELQSLEQASGPAGAGKDQIFIVQDKSGRNLSFKIRKKFGNNTEGDGYYLYGDGTSRPLYDTKFDNALLPYKTMMYLLQEDPTSLDALFNSKK